MTREEVIKRLENMTREMNELKRSLEEDWEETTVQDPTQAFLEKCSGWEDVRSPEEIVEEIYAARIISSKSN